MKASLPVLVRLVLVIPLLALAGCWASTPTLEVAIIGWPAYEYFYLAEQRQLGLRHGLKLKVRQFGSLQDQRLAYVRGDVDVLAADPIVLRRQPQRLRALVATWWEARRWADRHPGQAVALMAEREGLDPSAFTASEAGLTYRGPADQRRLLAVDGPVSASLQRIANLMVLAGRITPATPRPRPLTAALEGDG